ncbi:Protein SICKLE [Bienertia sinuspersici]
MEESEKRRERLRAMRLEATAEVAPSSSSSFSQETLISTPLPIPLLDNQESNTASAPPRFDFYTDPMAAYSNNKPRPFTPRPQFSPSQCGPRNPGMSPSGAQTHQFQNNYGPQQGMYQGGDPYYSPGSMSSPMGMRSPYPGHQGSPNFNTAPGRGNWFNNNPSPGPGHGGSPYPMYQGSPNFRSPLPPQGRGGHWSNNSPGPGPGPGCGGGPSPNVGRGRGQWDGSRTSPSPRYSGGGGRGRGGGYGDGQARSFYNKSMVEDPWESLTPVIWEGQKENDMRSFTNNRGIFQKTPAKKPRVSNPVDSFNSKKGGSLADFLAESFDEAADDTANV